jgi:hypothetical protein
MSSPNPMFTASHLASCLAMHRPRVYRLLAGVPPSGQVAVGGKLTSAWAFDALPAEVRAGLATAAKTRGYRDAGALLAGERSEVAAVSLDTIEQKHIDQAVKVREAMRLPLAKRGSLSRSELAELGRREYRLVFGHDLCSKTWLAMFDRIEARLTDGGDAERAEIYLEDRATAKPLPSKTAVRFRDLHTPLADVVAHLENQVDPTEEDRSFLFHSAFLHFERLIEANDVNSRKVKGSLIAWLFSAVPGLSDSLEGLRKLFDRSYARWVQGERWPDGIKDMRHIKSGRFRTPDFAEDLRKIRNEAIQHNGSESLAYRKLRQHGDLSQAFVDYYQFDVRASKSYVPATVRAAITPEVEMTLPLYRGPWEARMRGPYIPRNWGDTEPADYFSGDDVTFNSYFYHYDDRGALYVGRGECLLLCDLRTGYGIDFILIAGKYNGRHIRSLQLRGHDKVGLPRKGYYFERGVWASRYVAGDHRKRFEIHFRETEAGMGRDGIALDVRHATTPRAKPVEGIIRILQERQRSEPGFVGFNERIEEHERMQDFLRRCRNGKEHPGNQLLSMEQWADRITSTLTDYNQDPQNGKMLNGRSPAEAWGEAIARSPLRKLPDEARYILATHKQVVRVKPQGITLAIGNERLLYCNEDTGKLIGRDVLAFYNIDHPDLLTVSDMKREHYFSVPRIELPAMTATKEEFARANAQISGHRKAAKVIYGELQHKIVSTITRDDSVSDQAKELGRFHNEAVEDHVEHEGSTTRKLNRIRQQAVAQGQPILNAQIRNPDRVLRGQALEAEVRARIAQQEGLLHDE